MGQPMMLYVTNVLYLILSQIWNLEIKEQCICAQKTDDEPSYGGWS